MAVVLTVVIYKCRGRCVRESARWRGGGGNLGAAAATSGMQMVPVYSAWGGEDALKGVAPSAPLIRGVEEPMDVDPPPEAETRPLTSSRLFVGGGFNVSPLLPKPRE